MLKFYNTLTRKKEIFKPIKKGEVGIYTCGPTVYNRVHIGNLRAYVFADVLQRYLKYSGYRVRWVLNITDIEDKIIRDYKKSGKSLKEFTKYYEKLFFEDAKKINIGKTDFYKVPRATEHIKEMQKIIEKLIENRLAYENNGSIYFSIQKYIKNSHKYGQLLNINLKGLKEGIRVDTDEYSKENTKDFVLWKAKKDDDPSWDFKVGDKNYVGRPGWHIECSAMSSKYLGRTFDIHTGGVDLIFPHHENEIAQSEGSSGKKFVNFFVHNEHLLVDGHKMSKSLGNFYTLEDILKIVKNPLALRYLFLQAHYRSRLDFTEISIKSADETLDNIYEFILRIIDIKNNISKVKIRLTEFKDLVDKALNDDLNTPLVISVIHKLISDTNKIFDKLGGKEAGEIYSFILKIDEVLGLGFKYIKKEKLSKDIEILIDEREKARTSKDFEKADSIREELLKKGIELEDTPQGVRWRRIK